MAAKREGEIELAHDPAAMLGDAQIIFIGVVRSPWKNREDCPKNMATARERQMVASVEIAPEYRRGLAGLEQASHVAILTWLHLSPRNLIVQKPHHAPHPKGVFALRSPARPNPIGLHVAGLTELDIDAGILTLGAIDVLDGTPVIDIKPYYASVDAIPEATVGRSNE